MSLHNRERHRCRTPDIHREHMNRSTDGDTSRRKHGSSPGHSKKYPNSSNDKDREKDKPRSIDSSKSIGESSEKHVSRKRDRSSSPDRKVYSSKKEEKRKHSRSKDKKKSKEHKKKSKKKRDSSSSDSSISESSSSSSGSEQNNSELKLLRKLEANRLKMIDEKKKQKELIKANETPEEKRARRLAKKRLKERGRRARAGWHASHQGYTDHDNPFGDAALTDAFVWGKKLARLAPSAASPADLQRAQRQAQIENKIELEKVAARRAARAALGEAEAAGARAREDAHYSAWAALEHAFHLQQARLRSAIRVRDQRAKPIDLLAWYISSAGGEADEAGEAAEALHMHEPYTFVQGLSAADLDDLREDIKVYMELEGGEHAEYWRDVLFVVEDERRACRLAARPPVHASVADHCTQVLRNLSGAALEALAAEVGARLAAPRPGLDVSYWESVLTQLHAHMARARLRELHQRNLRRKLDALRREQGLAGGEAGSGEGRVEAEPEAGRENEGEEEGRAEAERRQEGEAKPEAGRELELEGEGERHTEPEAEASAAEPAHVEQRGGSEGEGEADEEEEEAEALEAWRRSGYSPPRVSARAGAGEAAPLSPARDALRLAARRAARAHPATPAPAPAHPAGGGGGGGGGAGGAEAALRRCVEAAEAADGGGARFGGELALAGAPPAWADKYRPRKPRYFNRVHTGFEWNKYNQTHYDMDNPPPKIVQGYKFNIFYPELIEQDATPSFSLKPCAESAEFAILRFSAGPPYEDIAFKIVNREWEYSYKRGFRCHFHNNIFQLWFHFKRYRYRR